MKYTQKILEENKACTPGKDWWLANGLDQQSIDLNMVEGDFNYYINWLKINVCSYTYDKQGNMLSETNPYGDVSSYTHDKQGNMLSETSANGKVDSWTYNKSKDCFVVTKNDRVILEIPYL